MNNFIGLKSRAAQDFLKPDQFEILTEYLTVRRRSMSSSEDVGRNSTKKKRHSSGRVRYSLLVLVETCFVRPPFFCTVGILQERSSFTVVGLFAALSRPQLQSSLALEYSRIVPVQSSRHVGSESSVAISLHPLSSHSPARNFFFFLTRKVFILKQYPIAPDRYPLEL